MIKITAGLERKLIDALEPIRGFVLAQALYIFMEAGLWHALADSGGLTVARLAELRNLSEGRLNGFLRYLANEDFVSVSAENMVRLTPKGSDIGVFQPWYTLLVGGYAPAFLQLGRALADPAFYAPRDNIQVGVGSCGISRFDALQMTERLLTRVPLPVRTIVDLGCGDGRYLIELCERNPILQGVGIELAPHSVMNALDLVRERCLHDRIDIRVGNGINLRNLDDYPEPLCFVTAFVLQEILEQTGRSTIVEMMQGIFAKYPDASWIVIEVDYRPSDQEVMQHGLGLGYYNPYYLIHEITEQRLETRQFWMDLFAESGLSIIGIETPDPAYDSLGLKLGYLLQRAH